jgi:type II secretory pathway pseudopilin PulG
MVIAMKRRHAAGFVYVTMLFAVAVFGLGLALVGQWTSERQRRAQEEELLRIGTEVVAAIRRHYRESPGTEKQFPREWEDLLEDRRFVGTKRHLRRIPRDPITGSSDWGIVTGPGGRMAGIYSKSEVQPLRQRAQDLGLVRLDPASRYSEWKFVYDFGRDAPDPVPPPGKP